MAKGRTKFARNVRKAIQTLATDRDLALLRCRSGSLFSPVFRETYTWMKLMDSDGLLVGLRTVKNTNCEGAAPVTPVNLTIGVIIQAEDATSQGKPNPFGKAAVGNVPLGVWFDQYRGNRLRLDRVFVLFVLPKGAPPSERKYFETAMRNVNNAADAMPDCDHLVVDRGISTADLLVKIKKKIRPWLKGSGRLTK
ncbi:MAG: hypothetical protein KBH81_01240 [Phycisphaerae bacterium]|nr:hypothetical protein [Phycisphaerae bacterium]